MEIRNNSIGSQPPSGPIDLTKANRDAIRERTPIPPQPPPQEQQPNLGAQFPKRIKNARETHQVRESFEHKRVQEARKRYQLDLPKDEVSLSAEAQDLASAKPVESDSRMRAQQVQDLKVQHAQGRLDVDSLVAEAARRMLSND